MREDAVAAQREVAQLTTQLTKANAKIEIAGGTPHLELFLCSMTSDVDSFKMSQEQQILALRDFIRKTRFC